jgi:hypothetical protein
MEHTANFGLTQWEKTDRIQMEDFNADNAKIDAALQALHTADRYAPLKTIVTTEAMTIVISQVGQRHLRQAEPIQNFAGKPADGNPMQWHPVRAGGKHIFRRACACHFLPFPEALQQGFLYGNLAVRQMELCRFKGNILPFQFPHLSGGQSGIPCKTEDQFRRCPGAALQHAGYGRFIDPFDFFCHCAAPPIDAECGGLAGTACF